MLGICSNEWADNIAGRNNASEDKLEVKVKVKVKLISFGLDQVYLVLIKKDTG